MPDTAAGEQAKLPEKRKGCSAALLAAGIAMVVFALLVLVLAQVAPDLLKLAGFRPKDLGVKWSATDYESIERKCGVLIDAPPEGTDRDAYRIEYSGEQAVDWTLTEQEITAWMNTNRPGYWPFSSVQVKIHPDNLLEASFYLDTAKLMTDQSVADCLPQEIKGYIGQAPWQVPLYAQAVIMFTSPTQAEVEVMALDAAGMQLMGAVDAGMVNRALSDAINAVLAQAGPVRIDALTTGEGFLRLQGTWYVQMKRMPAR
jgi:hypothetical protein